MTTRARKVAWAYRALVQELSGDDTTRLDELDERIRSWDEGWITPERVYGPDDWVSAKDVPAVAAISGEAIGKARIAGKIKGRKDGRRFMYRVSDVWEFALTARRQNGTQQSRVPDNGRSVSDGASDS